MMMYKRKYRQTTKPPQSWDGDVIRSYLHNKQSQQVNKVCRSSARVSPNTQWWGSNSSCWEGMRWINAVGRNNWLQLWDAKAPWREPWCAVCVLPRSASDRDESSELLLPHNPIFFIKPLAALSHVSVLQRLLAGIIPSAELITIYWFSRPNLMRQCLNISHIWRDLIFLCAFAVCWLWCRGPDEVCFHAF